MSVTNRSFCLQNLSLNAPFVIVFASATDNDDDDTEDKDEEGDHGDNDYDFSCYLPFDRVIVGSEACSFFWIIGCGFHILCR